MSTWNPWHGCHKKSPGCMNCYVYRQDAKFGKDSSIVTKTSAFDLPIKCSRDGKYKLQPNELVYTCFTSDFLIEDADEWRSEIWKMMRIRSDLKFFIITKRIDRLSTNLPDDWEDGYDNVIIACTVENQSLANYRIPIYLSLPQKHRVIICAPLLEDINLNPYLKDGGIKMVSVGGESGEQARICDYDWVLNIRKQCVKFGVVFKFHQTGAFLRKNSKVYRILRKFQHCQAHKAGIDYMTDIITI